MKKLVVEDDTEGLMALLGEPIMILCMGYFYWGRLTGVNDTCVKLEDPRIVFDAGDWTKNGYDAFEKMSTDCWYVCHTQIESFGPGAPL